MIKWSPFSSYSIVKQVLHVVYFMYVQNSWSRVRWVCTSLDYAQWEFIYYTKLFFWTREAFRQLVHVFFYPSVFNGLTLYIFFPLTFFMTGYVSIYVALCSHLTSLMQTFRFFKNLYSLLRYAVTLVIYTAICKF